MLSPRPRTINARTAGLLICLGVVAVTQQPARADNPDHITQFRATSSCVECDLSAANFDGEAHPGALASGSSFYGASLKGADLTNADLSNANLGMANLTDATLTSANLVGAKLWRAILSPGSLAGATTDATTVCPGGEAGPCS